MSPGWTKQYYDLIEAMEDESYASTNSSTFCATSSVQDYYPGMSLPIMHVPVHLSQPSLLSQVFETWLMTANMRSQVNFGYIQDPMSDRYYLTGPKGQLAITSLEITRAAKSPRAMVELLESKFKELLDIHSQCDTSKKEKGRAIELEETDADKCYSPMG